MKTGIVYHKNWIEEEINESYENHPDVDGEEYEGRMIYCKKLHKLAEPLVTDCDNCPFFAGFMQGHGHECAWEDVLDDHYVTGDEMNIPWEAREKEFLRVSRLIDKGVLLKGTDEPSNHK